MRKARLYEEYRLPYAPQSAGRLLDAVGPADVVVDVGAGTGQLARLFAPLCQQVYAVEPDAAMAAVAGAALRPLRNVTLVTGPAEATGLPDSIADLIVIGCAYHRFPREAGDELRRILKPAGWVALFSYVLPEDLSRMLFGKLAALEGLAARTEARWQRLPLDPLLGDAELTTLTIPHEVVEGRAAFIGNACSGIEAPEPGDPEFERFLDINREVFAGFAADGLLRLRCDTRIVFGRPAP